MTAESARWPAGAISRRHLRSFDGGVGIECEVQCPDRYAFFEPSGTGRHAIPRGAGLSYSAASFGADAVSVEIGAFDRILAFEPAVPIVEVEAGITLGALFRFLAAHRLYLPVQPGHGAISIGGCIAADVHGKNQARDGTFINQVEAIRLFHPDHGMVELSRTQNPDVFHATCGGYGLTGVIVVARLRPRPMTGDAVDITTHIVPDALEGARLLRHLARESDFVYSWHDFTRTGRGFGRGYVVAARFVTTDTASRGSSTSMKVPKLSADSPRVPPISALNRWTMPLLNFAYFQAQRRHSSPRRSTLPQSMFPVQGSESYFRLFGPAGFHEYQVILPHDGFAEFLAGVRREIARKGIAVALASAKLFVGAHDLLRFSGEGICFALNIPRNQRSADFLAALDQMTIGLGGRPNIIKDSRLPRSVLEASFPECDRFRGIVQRWDPSRRFRSELSSRLGL
ncbi:MAG TPA: FAD-binding oxidoreductase [Acetobacteraceae bacterium]|nr:FAD-binding oxidoreductase [Acetobacteraceae bacterium]